MTWRRVIFLANGEWAIIATWLFVFLIYHIVKVSVQQKVWEKGWAHLPMSLQLAISMAAISLSLAITRFVVSMSEFDGPAFAWAGDFGVVSFVIATITGIGGIFCALRVVTYPMIGKWPWVGALASSVVFIGWTTYQSL